MRRSAMDATATEQPVQNDDRFDRLRIGLVVILVVLVLLLAAIVVVIVQVIQPAGAPTAAEMPDGLTWVRSIYGTSGDPADQFVSPGHVAVGPNGTIWVTDSSESTVDAFRPDGSYLRSLVAASESGQNMLLTPLGVAVGDNGDVYVASFGTNTVIVWSADGEIKQVISVPAPIALAVRDETLFVTAESGLFLFSTDGEQLNAWSSRGSEIGQVDTPTGAAIGEGGQLYVSDTQNVQIKAFSPDGATVEWANPLVSSHPTGGDGEPAEATESTATTGTAEAPDAELTASLELPTGLTQDAAGRLVFADAFSFSLYAADAETGELLARYGEYGAADGFFAYPTGIAYDPARDWFVVADTANGRVQIVRIEGSGGSPIAAIRRLPVPRACCWAPLLLLLLAIAVALMRRRSRADGAVSLDDPESLKSDGEDASAGEHD